MQKAWIAALALTLSACGADLQYPGGPNNNTNNANNSQPTCDGLDGDTFNTVQDQSIGQRCEFDSQGNYNCTDLSGTWSIIFDNGDFYWDTYQVVDVGSYTCSNGNIVGELGGQTYRGTYANGVLTWDGLQYRR